METRCPPAGALLPSRESLVATHTDSPMPRSPFQILWMIVQAPLILFGAVTAAHLLAGQVELLPTFVSPPYANYWKDLVAYRLRAEGHKSLPELIQQYGSGHVH